MGCQKLLTLEGRTSNILGEEDLKVSVKFDGSLIDPYFIEATVLSKDDYGQDYSVVLNLQNIEPVKVSVGEYYAPVNLGSLPDIPGYYKIVWSIQRVEEENTTGYSQPFAVVR